MADLQTLYQTLVGEYKKDTDQDFPSNKIRFFMDLLWNAVVKRPLTDEQKAYLKQLIDLLNSLDDHKLSPMRELIGAMTPQITPLLTPYPSLGHTCTVIFTHTIPAYQKYLSSLEIQVKDAHAFTNDEILLYYDMTLVDHLIISHVFEQEHTLNLIEVIETIKTVITINALTHDYLQDALARSISMFTFLQRGGIQKDQVLPLYQELVKTLVDKTKENVTNADCIAYVDHMSQVLSSLATQAGVTPQPQVTQPQPTTPAPQADSSPASAQSVPAPQPVQTPTTVQQPNATSAQPQPQVAPPQPLAEVPAVPTQSPIQPPTPVVQTPAPQTQVVPQGQTPANQELNGVNDILQSLQTPTNQA